MMTVRDAMTYEEAIETQVAKAEALREIKKHEIDPSEFLAEVGDCQSYSGAVVLRWLGY